MYNPELKEKFIREYTNDIKRIKTCIAIFNTTEPYEQKWGADLCTKSEAELSPMLDDITGFRVHSKWSVLIFLKNYVKWCINTNVPGVCNGMLKADRVGVDKLKRQSVANPAHLQMYLNNVFSPESEETVDDIYRVFYWLAYGGMTEEDILSVKINDVDLDKMIVRYRGYQAAPLYREAIPAIKNCMTLTSFSCDHPQFNRKQRGMGDTLVRGFSEKINLHSVRTMLSRYTKRALEEGKTEQNLSYFRVWLSGLFYRMYEMEQIGAKVDFMPAAALSMEGKTYKLSSERDTMGIKQRQLARDYFNDYERWKLAYKI